MLKLAQSIVQIMCNNNHTMCDSYFLTLHFVINKVDVSYDYICHMRKHKPLMSYIVLCVCKSAYLFHFNDNFITLHLLFPKIFYELDINSLSIFL